MGIYSLGLLCFWLIFEAGSSGCLPFPGDEALESYRFIIFGQSSLEKNTLQQWENKSNNKLVGYVCWLLHEDGPFLIVTLRII